ncbi:MAG: zinc ribbon domain-containing protein [Thermoplasmata archaeon]|nr:zinc ribbon domain-containing protein [Thermoplasmata archaeon]
MAMRCPYCGFTISDQARFCELCGTDLRIAADIHPPASKSGTPIAIIIVIIIFVLIAALAVSVKFLDIADNSPAPSESPPTDAPTEDDTTPPAVDEKWSTVGVSVQNWNAEVTYSYSIYIDGRFSSSGEIRPMTSVFSSHDVFWTGTYFHNTTVEMRCTAGNQIEYVEVAENTIGASVTFKIDGPDWDW